MVDYENLPKGYLEKRKKASLRLIFSIYLLLVVSLIMRLGLIRELKLLNYLFYGSIAICGLFIFLSQTAKISFKSIPIPIYREIKVFTRKETIFYALPMVIILPFLGLRAVQIILILGGIYLAVKTGIRPPDAIEYSNNNSRHYR